MTKDMLRFMVNKDTFPGFSRRMARAIHIANNRLSRTAEGECSPVIAKAWARKIAMNIANGAVWINLPRYFHPDGWVVLYLDGANRRFLIQKAHKSA